MTAQQRSWMLRAGVLVSMVMAGVGFTPAPASADSAPVDVTVSQPNDFHVGGTRQTVTVTVKNHDVGGEDGDTQMTVSLLIQDSGGSPTSDFTIANTSGCTNPGDTTCDFLFNAASQVNVTFSVTPAGSATDVPAGGSHVFNGSVASVTDSVNTTTAGFSPKLLGAPLLSVSGTVYDITTGAAIPGALVNLQDSAAHSWLMTANSKGKFTFTSTGTKQIIAGPLVIGASKDHFKTITDTKTIGTTSITSWRVLLKPVVVATPSSSVPSSPTPSVSDSSQPSDGGSTDSTDGATNNDATNTSTDGGLIGQDAGDSGSSGGLFKYVLIMGLILALGGALVIGFMFYRRRRDDSGTVGGSTDPGPRGGGGGGARPGYRPVATGDGGRVPEPTMVARPGLADAPTMMHSRARLDEFADPYAAAPSNQRGARPVQPVGPGGGPRRPGGYGGPPAMDPGYRPPAPRQAVDHPQDYPPAQQPGYTADPTGYPVGRAAERANGYPRGGYPPAAPAGQRGGYQPPNGYQQQEYPPNASDYGAGYQQQGYPNGAGYRDQVHNGTGYPDQGYEDQGYQARPSYPDQGYSGYQNGAGYAAGGADPNGYAPQGGYDTNGYDTSGYNSDGYNSDGYDTNGYNAQGYNAAGYNAAGYHMAGYSAYPGDFGAPQGYPPEPDGYQQNGYQPGGYRGGYTPPEQRGSVDWLDD